MRHGAENRLTRHWLTRRDGVIEFRMSSGDVHDNRYDLSEHVCNENVGSNDDESAHSGHSESLNGFQRFWAALAGRNVEGSVLSLTTLQQIFTLFLTNILLTTLMKFYTLLQPRKQRWCFLLSSGSDLCLCGALR